MVVEKAYKELHSGIYEYGERKIKEAINLGYIESTYGFKLHLPNFDFFKKKHIWIQSLDMTFWRKYKQGKLEYRAEKKCIEEKKPYIVANRENYDLYRKNSYDVSQYFKAKAQYFKLCLNNPTQTKAAFQTKAAVNKVYEHIWKNNHFWDARISLVPHDEMNMEVKDELCDEYKGVIENAMVNEGNKFLSNPILFMKAECNIADNWWKAK